ncbi:MAG TPA: hypothetical protein VHW44_26480 [Pseudonocardiaceae bacterium]|jgi:hypothetical protein|nr:hypothetical protein [Pseudonocardiaceae bacterium]
MPRTARRSRPGWAPGPATSQALGWLPDDALSWMAGQATGWMAGEVPSWALDHGLG